MDELKNELIEANVGKVWQNELLKYHTTLKIGGPVDLLVQPLSKEQLITCMRIIYHKQVPYKVLGKGSNLLVRDGGFRGVIVKMAEGLDYLHFNQEYVTVGAGHSVVGLAVIVAKKELSGLEFAGGIPGSVGGAVYMNAGAHGSDMSHIVHTAEVLFEDGQVSVLSNEELDFSYRSSILQQQRKGICLEATFKLTYGDRQQILEEMIKHKEYRKLTQPLKEPCCGSVFRNPLPLSAGQLIEKAGLKGFRIGNAQISTMHANFIINLGDATANDVLSLIKHIQETIKQKYNVEMHPEVQVIGEM